MTITGLNHITLATTNLTLAVRFYRDALGLTLDHEWETGAYLSAGSLWLCLSVDTHVDRNTDYTHLAFTVGPAGFDALKSRLLAAGAKAWKENRSEGDSFYFTDPDGHRLEIHVGTLASRLAHIRAQNSEGLGCS